MVTSAPVSVPKAISASIAEEPEPFLSETWFNTNHDELYVPSRVFYPIGDQVYEINATFEAFDDERFYGLGQHKSGSA